MTRIFTLSLLCATLFFLGSYMLPQAEHRPVPGPEAVETIWTPIEELDAKLKKEPRPVIVEMYASWCGWCKKMDKTTFADPEVAALLNNSVYMVKINGETTDPFTFLGKETNGKEMRNRLKIEGYPTFVLLDEGQEKLEVLPGYKNPAQLKKIVGKLSRN